MMVLQPHVLHELTERPTRPDSPVLSVYLNLNPSAPTNRRGGYRLALEEMLKQIEIQLAEEEKRRHFQEDAAWTRKQIELSVPKCRSWVEAKVIATDIYVIEPVYEDYDSLYIKGYRINNIVAVTLRDVKKTSAILAAALSVGANQVINVEFYTSELRKYRDQARELAMKAAKEKAQALAAATGTEAGCVLYINENGWSYYNGGWYGRNQNTWTQNTVQNAAQSSGSGDSTGDGPISLGQISVKAEVGATFGLK